MAPSFVARSFSMTDVNTTRPTSKQRLVYCNSLSTPFDFSVAVGFGDKKNIFKVILRPRRTFFPTRKKSVPVTKNRRDRVENNLVPVGEAFCKHCSITGSKGVKPSQIRPRSKSVELPHQNKNEDKPGDLRIAKSLMLLPHLAYSRAKLRRNESHLIAGFPEKSVLLLAQDEDDRSQIQLSTSSVASRTGSQQHMRQRRGDSGVHISDEVVLTWSREEQSRIEPTNPSTSGLLSNQSHLRRAATKSSLQSNYIPSLDKLVEEPVLSPKVCGQRESSSKFVANHALNSGSNERKEFLEVVVSHWERAEQHQCTQQEQQQQPAIRNRRSPSSSFSLVNEVTEEVLFKRSSSNINVSRPDNEEETAKYQNRRERRVTIATESPSKELSPHYATQLEKQAFKKIKEWKEGFSIKLDQVLQQRQLITQRPDNKTKVKREEHISIPSPPTPPCLHDAFLSPPSYTPSYPSHTTPPFKPAEGTFRVDAHQQLIEELRGVSATSITRMSNGYDKGSTILKEIKKHRKANRGLNEKKKIMEELSFWHKKETGRIAKDLFTSGGSDAGNVKKILAALKETVDDIFIATIQRVQGDFVISSSSNNNSAEDLEQQGNTHTKHQEMLLKWQIKTAQEERDRLFLENITLKTEVADLQKQLKGAFKMIAALTSLEHVLYGHCARANLEKYIKAENFQETIGCLEEYTRNLLLNSDDLSENQDTSELLRTRQLSAEIGAIYSANLNLSAETSHFDCVELFSTWDCPYIIRQI